MIEGYTYLFIITLQLLNYLLEMLNTNRVLLVAWLPLSVWLSLWRLHCCLVHLPSSSSLPFHNSEILVNENIGKSVILAIFLHVWLTTDHLFAVIASNTAYNDSLSATLPAWLVLALATLCLVVDFAQYLEALAVPPNHWGYFYILYRIVTFVFDLVHAILWIIDLCQGRIELFRRRGIIVGPSYYFW
ncbi:hypothetical protein GYMLUDRAFT_245145 [Collybiopsis luxurians FD-317 M1]|uniref:Uncharacterized protein n=1 Tax=Collybiopsis luxurians FD-317 M1 TaxID=944289 RepID=A0A0D0BVA6_9AGAR|nr:hypothetical protein GYMLUDRAFT_245145 [Collybiopsis luxurians FD-317 M1]